MKRKRALAGLLILVVLVLFGVSRSWFAPAFHGGELTKGPLFSYPRYHARLPAVDVGHNGNYSAKFSGFPVRDVSIELDLSDKTYKDYQEVTSQPSTLSLVLDDWSGNNVCKATGRLSQISNIPHHWVLTGAHDFARLWNSDCLDLKLNPREVYSLTVIVEGADDKTRLPARPLLVGGGIELP